MLDSLRKKLLPAASVSLPAHPLNIFAFPMIPFIMSCDIKFLNYRNSLLVADTFAVALGLKAFLLPGLLKSHFLTVNFRL